MAEAATRETLGFQTEVKQLLQLMRASRARKSRRRRTTRGRLRGHNAWAMSRRAREESFNFA